MSIDHNRIKIADLEKNQPNKILTTNTSGELEFSDINSISYNALDYTTVGKALDARQGKILKDLIDNINTVLASDNINLNTLQELTDAIEVIQNSLSTFLVNDLTTGGTSKALTAEMGKTLKNLIDNINALLASDNINLNTLQKVVDAIEIVQNSLSTILVNDLTSGGATKALTAEMGKVLQNNKVDKVAGKNLLSDTEIARLATLSNYTHPANHDPGIIAQNPDNRFVTDSEKAIWNTKQSALGFVPENTANKNTANGYAGLGADGKLISSQLPSITVNDTFVIASQAAMLALQVETGDIAVRTDLNKSFILKGSNAAVLSDWQELLTPTSDVTTVFGRNGAITSQTGDYNADQISETAGRRFQSASQQAFNDATSSIQTQLNSKASTTGSGASGTWPINVSGNANTVGGLPAGVFMRSENANGYYGMATPSDGNTVDWIRTTSSGLIPYQSGNSGSIGTASWNFNTIYGVTFYENNTSLASKYLGINANAVTATNLSSNRHNWNSNGTGTAVVGQLSWNNYGNGHTIFDASSSYSPEGTAVSNTNSQIAWTPTFPSLMGWNGSNTYGLRVDSARIADSANTATYVTNDSNYRSLKHSNFIDIIVDGDANMFYPVIIAGVANYGFHRYSISRGYSWTAPDTWYTPTHKGGLTFSFEWSGDIAWGGNDHSLRVIQFAENYSNMVGGLAQPVTGGILVWLRGGTALYRIHTEAGTQAGATVYLNGFTAGDNSFFPPRTNTASVADEVYGRYPLRGNTDGSGLTGNAAGLNIGGNANTATSLANSRSINGVAFNGSSNITVYDSTKIPHQDGARYSTDFNTILTSGFYNAENAPANSPVGSAYGQLITAKGIDTGLQIYGGFHNDQLWFRGWANNGSSFTPWRKLLHDGNIHTNTSVVTGSRFATNTYDSGQSDSFSCSNWFRSGSASGWYNDTYGGGIWMQNSTNVEIYGNKQLLVNNNITATGDVIAYYSDERLKAKKGKIINALDKVKKLNGFYYKNNGLAKSFGYKSDALQLGLSAQEVQAVLPEIVTMAPFDREILEDGKEVSRSGENYLTVNYAKVVPLLIEAIKEQQLQIEHLLTKITK